MAFKGAAPLRRLGRFIGAAGLCAVAALVGSTVTAPVTAVPSTTHTRELEPAETTVVEPVAATSPQPSPAVPSASLSPAQPSLPETSQPQTPAVTTADQPTVESLAPFGMFAVGPAMLRAAASGTLLPDPHGSAEQFEGQSGWRNDFYNRSTTTIGGEYGVELKRISFKRDKPGGWFNETQECPANKESICLRLQLIGPDGQVFLDSSAGTVRKSGPGNGDDWLFTHGGETFQFAVDGREMTVNMADHPIYVPAGTRIVFDYGWNATRGKLNADDLAPENQKFEVDGRLLPKLKQPTPIAQCVDSKIFNAKDTSTVLFTQDIGRKKFTRVGGASGWKYNALSYRDHDGWLYAVSQKKDDDHPAGHLLAVNPNDGSVVDLGPIRGLDSEDVKGGINTGFITPNDQLWVANASLSGTGLMYQIDFVTGIARQVPLHVGYTAGRAAYKDPVANSNDYTFASFDGRDYAFGMVNQMSRKNPVTGGPEGVLDPGLERITLSSPDPEEVGRIDRFAFIDEQYRELATPTGETLPRRDSHGSKAYIYGAAWTYKNSTVGFSRNDGRVVQMRINQPGATPAEGSTRSADYNAVGAELLGIIPGPESYNNDGASCPGTGTPKMSIKKTLALTDDNKTVWNITVRNDADATASSNGYRIDDELPEEYERVFLTDDTTVTDFPSGTISDPEREYELNDAVCTVLDKNSRPARVTCFGAPLAPGESHTYRVVATLGTGDVCNVNTAVLEGFDDEPGVDYSDTHSSEATCYTFESAKTPLPDQQPEVDGDQPKSKISINNGTATTTSYYNVTVKNTTAVGNTPAEGLTPTADIVDTVQLPEGVTAEGAYYRKPGSDWQQAELLTDDDAAGENRKSFRIPRDFIGPVPADDQGVSVQVKLVASLPVSKLAEKQTRDKLTCTGGNPANDNNPVGLFNGIELDGVSEQLDPRGDNYACVTPEFSAFTLEKKAVDDQQPDRPGVQPLAAVVATDDGLIATSYYTITVAPAEGFPAPAALTGDIVDIPELPEGSELYALSYRISEGEWETATGPLEGGSLSIPAAKFDDVPADGTTITVKMEVKIPRQALVDPAEKEKLVCGSGGEPGKGIVNRAEINGTGPETDPRDDNSACVTPKLPDYEVAKVPATDQQPEIDGDQVTAAVDDDGSGTSTMTSYYDIRVKANVAGPVPLPHDIVDTPNLPDGVSVESGQYRLPDGEWTPINLTGGTFTIPAAGIGTITDEWTTIKVKMVTTTPTTNLHDPGKREEFECAADTPTDATVRRGLFNAVALAGSGEAPGKESDNYACVTPDLPSLKMTIKKDPRPGAPVQADHSGRAVVEYTITVANNDEKLTGNTGVVVDRFLPPEGVAVDGDVTVVESDGSSDGVKITDLVGVIAENNFTADKDHQIASNVLLPPNSKAMFTVTIPVRVTADVPAWNSTIATCGDGNDGTTPGIRNTASMQAVDSAENPTADDTACVPVTPPAPATVEVVKGEIDPTTGKPTQKRLEGAQFAVYAADEDGNIAEALVPSLTETADGKRTTKLYPGTYFLVETQAPVGYSLLVQPVKFIITANESNNGYTARFASDTILTEATAEGDTITMTINDLSQGLLPASGGPGVPWYLALGSLVMMLGFVWARKKTADARSGAFDT